ncbi:MAG TPA: 4-carboxymuconolactone decarboxylase [Acidimicrobiia bacterium]|jgi:4-carboxymuconolactone decarboxylase
MGSIDDGMTVRRSVLGPDHVDRANEATTDLDRAFQEWITESIWGSIWTRDGIDLKTRSMITIAILAALNHEELELHLRAARNTGVSPSEIAEVLLHVAAYAGAPAGNRGFKIAKSLYDETAP